VDVDADINTNPNPIANPMVDPKPKSDPIHNINRQTNRLACVLTSY